MPASRGLYPLQVSQLMAKANGAQGVAVAPAAALNLASPRCLW